MTERKKAVISIILAAIFTGGTGVASKFALRDFSPITFTFLRFLIGSICVTPFLLKEGKTKKPTLAVLFLSLMMVLNPSFYTFGIRLTTVTVSQTLFASVPILTVFLAYFIIREEIPLRKAVGVAIGFIGTIIIILLPVVNKYSAFSGNFIGNLFVSVSVTCLAFYSVLTKKLQDRYTPIYLTSLFIYLTAILNGFLALPEILSKPNFLTNIHLVGWLGLLYAGSFGVSFFLLYQYAIKHGSPVIASTSGYLSPIFAFIFAFFLLGEQLTSGFIIGSAFALVGVYLVTIPDRSFLKNIFNPKIFKKDKS